MFDSDYNILVTPISPEITVRFEKPADELKRTPATVRENSTEICPQTDRSSDGTDTDHYMQPDVDTSGEQRDPTPTNPVAQNMIYIIIQNQIVMTITDIESVSLLSTERIRTLSGNPRNVL